MELVFNMQPIRGLTGIYDATNYETTQKQSVPRRKRTQTTYTNISNDCREELVKRVTQNKEKIIEVAKDLKLNYSTAKSILRVYKSQQRVEKIPQKLRIKRKRRNQKIVANPQFSTAFAASVMSTKSESQDSQAASSEREKSVKLEVEDCDSKLKVEEQEVNAYTQPIFSQYQTNSVFIDHAALQQKLLALQKNKELEVAARVKPSYHAGYIVNNQMPYVSTMGGKMESYPQNTAAVENSIFLYNKLMLERARNELINSQQMMTPNLFLGNNLLTSESMSFNRMGYNLF